jgi:hypothetical protein
MKLRWGKSLTYKKLQSSLVVTRAMLRDSKYYAYRICKRPNGMILILAYLLWLENLEFSLSTTLRIKYGNV